MRTLTDRKGRTYHMDDLNRITQVGMVSRWDEWCVEHEAPYVPAADRIDNHRCCIELVNRLAVHSPADAPYDCDLVPIVSPG